MAAVDEQLAREPKELPSLKINYLKNKTNKPLHSGGFEIEDFILEGYDSYPKLQSETKLSTGLK